MAQAKEVPYTQAELHELLDYDPQTGEMTWRTGLSNRARPGRQAGTRPYRPNGQPNTPTIGIGGRRYHVARIIWLLVYEREPEGEIGFRNGNPHDLRLTNLREGHHADHLRNQRMRCSNTSGHPGVFWNAQRGKWQASVTFNGKTRYLGLFTNKIEAVAVAAQTRLESGFSLRHATGGQEAVLSLLPDWLR